jgi:hypothetical protein
MIGVFLIRNEMARRKILPPHPVIHKSAGIPFT